MKAFNSLSRDHVVEVEGRLKLILISLSTPSLGITLPIDCSMFITDPNFQLPLSGSPSPIPGFSGSPRLSAAAPLRINDS